MRLDDDNSIDVIGTYASEEVDGWEICPDAHTTLFKCYHYDDALDSSPFLTASSCEELVLKLKCANCQFGDIYANASLSKADKTILKKLMSA